MTKAILSESMPAENTIFHDAAHPSHVVLPVIPKEPRKVDERATFRGLVPVQVVECDCRPLDCVRAQWRSGVQLHPIAATARLHLLGMCSNAVDATVTDGRYVRGQVLAPPAT